MTRLQLQDALITASMGGVLPEQLDPSRFQRVLDVGCGTGGWLMELAKTMPDCPRLIGVDVSLTYVEYARAQAQTAGVGDRVAFYAMDALRMLEFPTGFFDLVNQRFGMSWLRTWDWAKLLHEYRRVCRPEGIIRVTETAFWDTTSPALQQLTDLAVRAAHQAGHLCTPQRDSLTAILPGLLHQLGMQQVQTRPYQLVYRAGTPEGQHFGEDLALLYRTCLPFLRKWVRVPEQYEDLYRQMLIEIQQPDFVATMDVLTVWGRAEWVL